MTRPAWWRGRGARPPRPRPRLRSPLLQVAAKALETGVFGAYFNVLINLKDITDDVFKDQVGRRRPGLGPQWDPAVASVLRCHRVAWECPL